MRRWLAEPLAGAALAAGLAVAAAAAVPVLDEESYLSIGRDLVFSRPYDWWRPWPPWGAGREADAFVFAHPPLFLWWAALWARSGLPVGLAKALAGAPFAALLGLAAGRLAQRWTRRPRAALALFLTAPITVLGLQRGLMPDLALAALVALAVLAWVEAEHAAPRARGPWLVAGGLALAAASWVKYPAVLVAIPLLAAGGWRRRWPFWVAAALPLALGEGWLWAAYGRPHPLEVLARAGEIPRGPAGSRWLGVAARLSLGVLPVAALARRRGGLAAAAGAAALVAWGAPAGSRPAALAAVGAFAAAGLLALGPAIRGLGSRETRLAAGWALVVVLGVGLAHNFAAPRYLLPAMPPLALLAARAAPRRLAFAAALLQGALAVAITGAEHRFFAAGDAVAREVLARHPEGGAFSGEWSFRWRMARGGWRFWPGEGTLPPGTLVALPEEASPPPRPDGWQRVEAVASEAGRLRVACAARGIGLYGDTLGVLPLGWVPGPLEEATVWRVPGEAR